jgi:tetratricopeptide (TPR) repeat protein
MAHPRRREARSTNPDREGRARRLLFGFAAAVVVPLAVLLAAEGSLRLLGVGFDPCFFQEREIASQRVITDNPRFGWRFFPPAVSRGAPPFVLPREKPPGTVRIFVLGGSAAMGDPSPDFGLPRLLQAMLEICRPDLSFEVVNAAMPAINSHVVLPIARDCLERDADLLVVYLGNNEVLGPFGAGSVFGIPGAGLRLARAQLWAKSLRLGQLLERILAGTLRRGREAESWQGLEFFVGNEITRDDPRLSVVRENFRRNLEDLCRAAARRGVPVVLSTVGVNLRDCAPFASRLAAGLAPEAQRRFAEDLRAGIAQEASGRSAAACESYRAARDIAGDSHAELLFRLARILEADADREGARACYTKARDADALRFRADSPIDSTIREVAASFAEHDVRLVDGAGALAGVAAHAAAGAESFDDHVHLTFAGNYEVARSLMPGLLAFLPPGEPVEQAFARLPGPEACAARLGYEPTDRLATLEIMQLRRARAPFAGQIDEAEWRERIDRSLDSLAVYERPHYLRKALAAKEQALREHPEDWVLRQGVADLLGRTGDWAGALRESARVAERLPHSPDVRYALGLALQRLGRTDEAVREFEETIELLPGHFLAHVALGEILLARGEPEAALSHFDEAVRRHPRFAAAHRSRGGALLELGRTDEAIAAFEEAIEVNPALAGAHKRLGDALIRAGRPAEAIRAYRGALEIHPAYAAAHEALGDVYREEGQTAEAARHYERALEIRPDSGEVRRKLSELREEP